MKNAIKYIETIFGKEKFAELLENKDALGIFDLMEEYKNYVKPPNKKLRIEDVLQVLTEEYKYEIVDQCDEHIILTNAYIMELGQHSIRLEINKYNDAELSFSVGQFPEELDNEIHLPLIEKFMRAVLEEVSLTPTKSPKF